MEWVKLIAVPAYYIDGALLRAGEQAEVLFCRGIAYCGGVESGGVIDKTVLPMIVPTKAKERAEALVREGLWLDEGAHYRIRTWDKWQDEHDIAAEKRKRERERKRDYRRKARTEEGHVPGTSHGHVPESPTGQSADSPTPKRDSPTVDVEGDVERDKNQLTTSVGVASKRPTTRATRIPEEWPPNPETGDVLRAWAAESAPGVNIRYETDNWLDWHRAKGDTAKDWVASWRTWMRRAQKDAEKRGPGQLALGMGRRSTTDQRVADGIRLVEQYRLQEGA